MQLKSTDPGYEILQISYPAFQFNLSTSSTFQVFIVFHTDLILESQLVSYYSSIRDFKTSRHNTTPTNLQELSYYYPLFGV